ncbi:MAG TPA: hypothetical protein VIH93_03040, partial [Thermoanaerobaculia bacterium]
MKIALSVLLAALAAAAPSAAAVPAAAPDVDAAPAPARAAPPADWSQWGQNPQHTGVATAAGQPATRLLADFVYDPFVAQEKGAADAFGELLVHDQSPLVHGADV